MYVIVLPDGKVKGIFDTPFDGECWAMENGITDYKIKHVEPVSYYKTFNIRRSVVKRFQELYLGK